MGLLETVKQYPKRSAAAALILSLAAVTPTARRMVHHYLQPEISPTAHVLNPDGTRMPRHIRTDQLIHEIEANFPLIRATAQHNLQEMDRQDLPHIGSEMLLSPFLWVAGNSGNVHRNIEQVRHNNVRTISVTHQQFFYGLLPGEAISADRAFALYDPDGDIVQLPESFNIHQMVDVVVLYHEMWHRIRKANLENELGIENYAQQQSQIALRMRELPPSYTNYSDLDDEALAHYMEIELLNVLLKGELQQTRGMISLADLAERLETRDPIRISALATVLILARALYNSPTIANPTDEQYPPDYLQAIVDLEHAQRIIMYRVNQNGTVHTYAPSGIDRTDGL